MYLHFIHMSWRNYVVLFQAEANIRFQHSIFLWGASHLQCNSGNPCRDCLFCAMKLWLVGGLRGHVGPCCFKTSWWFVTSGFGREKGFVQRWWQKLNTCQGVVFMHSSFRSLLGIAFDVLAQGGSEPASHGFFVASSRSRSINLAVKLGAKNMHENLFMFKTFAWMKKLPMTGDFFGSSRLWQRHIENICRHGAKVSIGHVMWSLKASAWWMFSPQMLSIEFYDFMYLVQCLETHLAYIV